MSFESWTLFAVFWAVFVATPGPNAVNCINNGMTLGMARAMVGVLAILTQAALFLMLSALGISALITASPETFTVVNFVGAAFLIVLGIRGWMQARTAVRLEERPAKSVYLHALGIALLNPRSVAGYFAAFSQFVQPEVPVMEQMVMIVPTALTLTALSYTGFTALGAGLDRAALGAVFHVTLRRVMAFCFIIYGVLLGSATAPVRG